MLRLGYGPFEFKAGVLALLTMWIVGGAGVVAWLRAPTSAVGPLLVAASAAWAIANLQRTPFGLVNDLTAPLQLLYAAIVGHAVVAAEGDRQPRIAWLAIVGAYVGSLLPQPVAAFVVSLALVLALGAVLVIRVRHRSAAAWPAIAGVAFAVAIGFSSFARWYLPSFLMVDLRPAIEIGLILTAASLALTAARAAERGPRVTDLVVDLSQEAGGGIARRLASALGDPSLELSFALGNGGRFVDAAGHDVTLPAPGSGRAVTLIDHHGQTVAALIHDPATRPDPAVRSAIARAADLAGANARLQAGVQAQLVEVAASRRRLLDAADEERRVLRTQLDDDLGPQLDALEAALAKPPTDGDRASADAAVGQLAEARQEMAAIADGLNPRALAELGLAGAVQELARRSAIPVEVAVGPSIDADLASQVAVYFVSSEALANSIKHARASSASVRLSQTDGNLTVEIDDDGVGGADPAQGTGLRGLRDRVEALGGWLTVADRTGHGTRIVASVPTRR